MGVRIWLSIHVASPEYVIGTMVPARNSHENKHQMTSKAVMPSAHRGLLGAVLSSHQHHSSVLTTFPAVLGASDTTSR